jgi:hypothetical protein
VADMTWNTTPSLTMLGTNLWLAYQKTSHDSHDPTDPPTVYGTYIGRLSPRTASR